jgi:hypothetical protein
MEGFGCKRALIKSYVSGAGQTFAKRLRKLVGSAVTRTAPLKVKIRTAITLTKASLAAFDESSTW